MQHSGPLFPAGSASAASVILLNTTVWGGGEGGVRGGVSLQAATCCSARTRSARQSSTRHGATYLGDQALLLEAAAALSRVAVDHPANLRAKG
jgi:hypothetical protein